MRLRNILAATAASALIVGVVGTPTHAVTAPSPAKAGSVVAWGDEDNPNAGAAIPVPTDLGPVQSVAANMNATGAVTLNGGVHVWGNPDAAEVASAPKDITGASAIAFTINNGAVLHTDGRITAWGDTAALRDVPSDLRAKAIALQISTGYAVRPDGTLTTWGEAPLYPMPAPGLTDLVDVSASQTHVLALRADGTVVAWGNTFLPGLLDVPDFGGKKVVKIATGTGYSGVVFADGSIDIWGFSFLIPANEPSFDGLTPATKVVDLSLGTSAAAVTADGAVHVWGDGNPAVAAVPTALTGQHVSAVAMGTSHAVAIVTAFRDLTKPTVHGTAKVGQTLTATPATFSLTPDAPATGQWYAGTAPIAGKTGTTLTLGAPLVGKPISYRATATRGEDTVKSSSAATARVAKVTSKVSGKAKATGLTKKVAGKVTFTLTVTSAKGVSPAGKVTVSLKGKKAVAARVNAAGKATVVVKNVKRGRYAATVRYAGNSGVSAAKGSVRFKA